MKKILVGLLIASTILACNKETSKKKVEITVNKEVKKVGKWVSLFDGETLDGWHIYNGGDISTYWGVEEGAIAFAGRKDGPSFNLVSDKEYTNFKLSLEWKISEAGNSGIMYGVVEDKELNQPYLTGPEIQILDNDKHAEGKIANHRSGSLFDMIAPSKETVKEVGKWNKCVIMINHESNEGKIWINDVLIVEFPVHGEEWDAMVANSKFKDWKHFGKNKTGKIAFQDHNNKVSFRNIMIKEL